MMASVSKLCTTCELRLPSGSALLAHFMATHQGTQTTEWFVCDDSVSLSPSLKSPSRPTCQEASYSALLVINTSPVSKAPRRKSAKKPANKPRLKCPALGCKITCHISSLEKHFLTKHSLKCPYAGCSFTQRSLFGFIKHYKQAHIPLSLPMKRSWILDEEAAAEGGIRRCN
jgi:hypothetical protein